VPLTDVELAYLRSEIGSTVDEADLDLRYERLGTAVAVAHEVVRERLATLLSGPSSFSLPGVYSESTNDGTIRALQAQTDRLQTTLDAVHAPAVDVQQGGAGRIVRTDRVR